MACALALGLASAPTAAAAKQGWDVVPPSASALISPHASRGFYATIVVPNDRVAALWLTKEFEGEVESFMDTGYIVRRPASDAGRRVVARFGDRGRLSLRFVRRSTRVHRLDKGCRGRPTVTEVGLFRGRIEFEGESGYSRISTVRAPGQVTRSFRLHCRKGHGVRRDPEYSLESYAPLPVESGSAYIGTELTAVADTGNRVVSFEASRLLWVEGAKFTVGARERIGQMVVARAAHVEGGAETLVTSRPGAHPATATVQPPVPFRGEASFVERSVTSHAWTGTLMLPFPGLALPLTGPEFATGLCVLKEEARLGCDSFANDVVRERR